MKKLFLFAMSIVAVTAWISCARPVAPEYLGFRDLKFQRFSVNESLLETKVAFYNPNPFNLQLKRADINVFLDDKQTNHYVLDSTIEIPKKDTFEIPLNLKLNPQQLLGSAVKMLMNNNQVKIRLDGSVRVKRSGVSFTVPVHYEEMQKIDLNF